MAKALEVNNGMIDELVVYLRKWHALEGQTGQNEGSNGPDDGHGNLEMHAGAIDRADLEGLYSNLNSAQKTDVSALVLIGMGEESDLETARQRILREETLDLNDLLEMPMAPEYLASAYARFSGQGDDNVVRLTIPENR